MSGIRNGITVKERRRAKKDGARKVANLARWARGWTPPGGSLLRRVSQKTGKVVQVACTTVNWTFWKDTKEAREAEKAARR